jgi:CPA1 family monovalent cation:H+ antiporter
MQLQVVQRAFQPEYAMSAEVWRRFLLGTLWSKLRSETGFVIEIHSIQTVLLLLLVVVAGFAVLADRLKVPYPIVLLLAGLALSFVPHVPRVPLNPQLVFLVFLPPLLYRAAWLTSWREFRYNLVSTMMLAVGLVVFTIWGVAEFSDRFITALDWRAGFVLGAVVATTDAVAAAAIAKRVGLPKRIVDVLEGESLLNDATGLLALQFGIALVVEGRTPTVAGAIGTFAWLVAGGIGMGLLVGLAVVWCERHIEDGPVEIVVSVVAAYASYLLGEKIGASGVLAVIACGLFVSRKSAQFFSPQVRIQVMSVWGALDFALNGLVFCLIGLQLPYVLAGIHDYSWETLAIYGAVFSSVLILLRLLWMYPGSWVAWKIRRGVLKQKQSSPKAKSIFVVGWTGMRGVLALAAAISLPEKLANGQPFVPRDLIIFLTFCVIFVTLVLQGLTLPALISWLGLAREDKEGMAEEKMARQTAVAAGIAWLQTQRYTDDGETAHVVEDLLHQYGHRLDAVSGTGKLRDNARVEAFLRTASGAAQAERRALIQLRDDGKIGDETMRAVELELDLTESRIEATK